MAAVQRQQNKVQRYIWLSGGLLCLFLAFMFWIMTDKEQLIEVKKTQEEEIQTQIQPEKVGSMTDLGALVDEVRPLETSTRIVASGMHEPEFRGTKFMQEHKKLWTIELFRSSEEDIIKSFLKRQTLRQPFLYFRLSGEATAQHEQYVLVYGQYKSTHEAEQALAQLNLNLPASLHPVVQKFEHYTAWVNDLGSEEMAGSHVLEVRLKPAALPRVDESLLMNRPDAPATPTKTENRGPSTVKTTIVRRDQDGNVVDVQRSQSSAPTPAVPPRNTGNAASTPVNGQISDPFN